MPDFVYPSFKTLLGQGAFDLSRDTLGVCLLTEAHAPDPALAALADLSGETPAGGGYETGGKTLSGVTWTLSGSAAVLDADDPVWSPASLSARYAVVYARKTVPGAVNPLVCLFDFGQTRTVAGGTFSLSFDPAGILGLG